MPDYSQCKTYIIKFYDDDKLIYIGSTTQSLQNRLCSHRKDFKCSLYKYILNNYDGDFKCCFIELHQIQSCNNKPELDIIEGELIKQFKADENNIVIRVLVGNNDTPDEGESFMNSLGGTWIKTSYNSTIRKNFANPGMQYDVDRDAFIYNKPFESWS